MVLIKTSGEDYPYHERLKEKARKGLLIPSTEIQTAQEVREVINSRFVDGRPRVVLTMDETYMQGTFGGQDLQLVLGAMGLETGCDVGCRRGKKIRGGTNFETLSERWWESGNDVLRTMNYCIMLGNDARKSYGMNFRDTLDLLTRDYLDLFDQKLTVKLFLDGDARPEDVGQMQRYLERFGRSYIWQVPKRLSPKKILSLVDGDKKDLESLTEEDMEVVRKRWERLPGLNLRQSRKIYEALAVADAWAYKLQKRLRGIQPYWEKRIRPQSPAEIKSETLVRLLRSDRNSGILFNGRLINKKDLPIQESQESGELLTPKKLVEMCKEKI